MERNTDLAGVHPTEQNNKRDHASIHSPKEMLLNIENKLNFEDMYGNKKDC